MARRLRARSRARRRKLARRFNLKGAVRSLTRPKGPERLKGPAPVDEDGLPLAPFDAYGHDLLWWLDRMVRTNHPLVERMALDLARLVRDRRRRLAAALDPAGPAVRAPLDGAVLGPVARRHRRPGDADLALGRRQPTPGAERELRPRADGAVHARGLGRLRLSLLGGRRARAGPRAHRLGRRLAGRRRLRELPLRRRSATTRARRRSSARRAPSTGPTRAGSASATPRTRRSSSTSCGATSSRCRPTTKTRKALERIYVKSGYTVRAGGRGDPHAPDLLPRARRW